MFLSMLRPATPILVTSWDSKIWSLRVLCRHYVECPRMKLSLQVSWACLQVAKVVLPKRHYPRYEVLVSGVLRRCRTADDERASTLNTLWKNSVGVAPSTTTKRVSRHLTTVSIHIRCVLQGQGRFRIITRNQSNELKTCH